MFFIGKSKGGVRAGLKQPFVGSKISGANSGTIDCVRQMAPLGDFCGEKVIFYMLLYKRKSA